MSSTSLQVSVIWKFLERASVQIISLVVQIILARLIAPEDFGSLSIILVFYNLFDIFVQKGFGSSIVRKKDLSKTDVDTTLVVSLFIALVAFVLIYCVAPLIGQFYGSPGLVNPLRVLSASLIISPFFCIYNSLLIRDMQFKIIFIRGVISSVLSGLLGIYLALKGWGLWALVIQIVVNQLLLTIVMAVGANYKLGFSFSKSSFNEVFKFGRNVLATETLLYVVESLRTMSIGKVYTTTQLAYYDRGQTYPNVMMNAVNDTFFSTFLPYFSRIQGDNEELKKKYLNLTKIVVFITTPIFVLFAAVSEEFIEAILTIQWIDSLPFLIIFCVYQTIFPYQTICKVVLYAVGDSKVVLNIELWKSAISFFLLVISLYMGVIYVALSLILVRLFSVIMYILKLRKYVGNAGVIRQTYRPFISGTLMFLIVFNFNLEIPVLAALFIKAFLGVLIYVLFECVIDYKYVKNMYLSVKQRYL